ncbi:MAG TPA: hypothetical protein VIL85_00110, partial [Thermomicrobiales bacterium]
MTVGVEKRRKRVLIEPIAITEEPVPRRLTTLRARISERWGPIAPHAIATVALYVLFAVLARLIVFGRVQVSPLLYAMIGLAMILFLGMIAVMVRTLWQALRTLSTERIPDGWKPILLATMGAGGALVTLPRLFSK